MLLHVRCWFKVGGGHTHVRVFVGPMGPMTTHAKAGDLTFRNEEWDVIRAQWERLGWQIVPEEEERSS